MGTAKASRIGTPIDIRLRADLSKTFLLVFPVELEAHWLLCRLVFRFALA